MGHNPIMGCSAPGWVSGGCTGTGIDGYRFEPFRLTGLPWPRMHQHGDHWGRMFPTVEAGSAFALERGYSVPYRSHHAVLRTVERDGLRHVHRRAIRDIRAAASRAALAEAIDVARRRVAHIAGHGYGDVLSGGHWACGWWAAARRLRPELFAAPLVFNQYRVTVRHDSGTVVIRTAALNEDGARRIVEAAEGCPASAIKRVEVVRPRRDYWRGSNAGDRRESRMLARLAR